MNFPTSGCASWYDVTTLSIVMVFPVPVGISSRPCPFASSARFTSCMYRSCSGYIPAPVRAVRARVATRQPPLGPPSGGGGGDLVGAGAGPGRGVGPGAPTNARS